MHTFSPKSSKTAQREASSVLTNTRKSLLGNTKDNRIKMTTVLTPQEYDFLVSPGNSSASVPHGFANVPVA